MPISQGSMTPAGCSYHKNEATENSKLPMNVAQLGGGSAPTHSITKYMEMHFNSSYGSREKKALSRKGKLVLYMRNMEYKPDSKSPT